MLLGVRGFVSAFKCTVSLLDAYTLEFKSSELARAMMLDKPSNA
jgi:hypothetical protein